MNQTKYPQNFLSQKLFWLDKLSGEIPETNLLLDRTRPLDSNSGYNSFKLDLSESLSQEILDFSKGSYFSTYWILLSALNTLLHKYTQNNDVIIGIPAHKQSDRDSIQSKVVPLRTQISPDLSFKDFLLRVKDEIISAYNNQSCELDELSQLLEIPKIPNNSNIFNIVALLENIHNTDIIQGLNNDLTFIFAIKEKNIACEIKYKNDLFQSKNIELFAKYFINVLKSVSNNIEIKIADIIYLQNTDRDELLNQFNFDVREYPISKTINHLFERQVKQTPDSIAAIYKENKLTYQELDRQANQVARLLRGLGVTKGEFVGIFKDRDLNFLVAILAIHKAGGAYVPIDSNYPADRIEYMLSNSEVKFLFTDCSLLNTLENCLDRCQQLSSIICLDDITSIPQSLSDRANLNIYQKSDFEDLDTNNLEPINNALDPAYLLYTSGSTGLPKGAIIRHDGAINHIYAQYDRLELGKEFTFLQSAPASTDISVWQFLAPLLIGGKTVIVDLETVAMAEKLYQILRSAKITVVELVPTLFSCLLEYLSQLEERELPDLQWMMLSGESISIPLINKWLAIYPQIKIANAYGPTEAADDITQFIVDKPLPENQRTVPIGKPLANLNLYILDKEQNLLPIGSPGEICVSGIGVGDGYWRNEQKTKQAFANNPFTRELINPKNHDVIYRTGDLGRWLHNGNIEFLGRIDRQVKIRGFRVELGEIEARLAQHPKIVESAVIVRQSEMGNVQLIAYVVTKKEPVPSIKELRSFLKSGLPEHMIPSGFMMLDRLPIAPSGKIDRQKLPELNNQASLDEHHAPPRNGTEAAILKIWQQVLENKSIGIRDNFFEIGGHSLNATRVISQIRQIFAVEIPLRSIFEYPTVVELAQQIAIAIKPDSEKAIAIEPVSRKEKLPLSFAQQRLWFLNQLEPESAFHNISAGVRLQGKLNIKALEKSFNKIIARHETLRTNFITEAGEARIAIAPFQALDIPLLDFSSFPVSERSTLVRQQTENEATQAFNLKSDRLIKIKLLKLAAEEHILLVTMHHIISDGWSIDIVVGELATLYRAFSQGQGSPLEELAIQYVDFAVWQKQWLQGAELATQKAYWLEQLADAPQLLELPSKNSRSPIQTFRGSSYSWQLSPELSAALNKLSQKQGSTLFMTLLAAFQILLSRYTGQEDILVGSPIANRNRAEVESLIGAFINTLVLRTKLTGDPSFKTLLQQVKEVALGAYAHQDLPFELLVEELQPERNLSYSPIFQVMFVLQNAPMSELELPGLTLTPIESQGVTAQFDLTLSMTETDSGLEGSWEYNTDLFDEVTISRMAEHFGTLLSAIVDRPEQNISQLPLLTPAEEKQILFEWNDTETEYPQDLCFHQLFERQVEQTPDAVAVVFGEQKLTYDRLNRRANKLASYLQKLGVKPEFKVGICVERSPEMIIAMLAILKAGGAYLPLDPTYPPERLSFMLSDSQVGILLTTQKLPELGKLQAQVIYLDGKDRIWEGEKETNPDSQVTVQDLAYLIYTSGSTGTPKGVLVPHEGLVNLTQDKIRTCKVRNDSRVLQFFSFSFDASIPEIVMALGSGAALYLGTQNDLLPGEPLAQFLRDRSITHITVPPSALAVLPNIEFPALEMVLVGGEAPTPELISQWSAGRLFINAYGPTETTVNASMVECGNGKGLLPTVRPSANKQLYVLDANLQPLPIGIPGELHIAGVGLARGYLNRPQKTAEAFIPIPPQSPLNKGGQRERMYKTGDLACYLNDGRIQLMGRLDHQVKIRGFRIEPGEIEVQLNQHPEVEASIVIVREDKVGDKQLVAYLVSPNRSLKINDLHRFLADKLPKYMIPSVLVTLDRLPLNPNGKVDRFALPKPDYERSQLATEFVSPRNDTERVLAEIFAEVLSIEQVGIYDNFFDLGGHSLLITKLIAQLLDRFKVEVRVIDMFEDPTVEGLAKRIAKINSHTSDRSRDLQVATLLRADAVLDELIQPESSQKQLNTTAENIFLTGATGFVGAFLLYELLQQTSAHIHCLIRADNNELVQNKLEKCLKSYSLWQEDFKLRITPVIGDLSQPLLGLSEAEFQQLTTQIDVVYHNGAWVNHVFPYGVLKDTNVLGTQEVLRLACQSKVKPVHFISATSVFSEPENLEAETIREEDSIDRHAIPSGGYSQSKWVAEKLVRAAGDRGLPINIYRIGRVSGHSTTGVFNVNDYLYRLIIGCVRLGSIPDIESIENIIPVDYVSQGIVRLSQQPGSIDKAFHLTNPQSISTNIFFDKLRSLGYPMKKIAYQKWHEQLLNIAANSPEHPLYPLVSLFSGDDDTGVDSEVATIKFDCQNTLDGLKDSSISCPAIDDRLLDVYFSYLIKGGFLPTRSNSQSITTN